jgi:hypothetical protein
MNNLELTKRLFQKGKIRDRDSIESTVSGVWRECERAGTLLVLPAHLLLEASRCLPFAFW